MGVTLDQIEAVEMTIARCVLQGEIARARDYAQYLAELRDSRPTFAEQSAALSALRA
ncbi:hypothetical protein [Microbacterium xylanilyticum]